jgi:hypothetical protein
MKQVSARASMRRDIVDRLFGTPEAARETTRKILESRQGVIENRTGSTGRFVSSGVALRTERVVPQKFFVKKVVRVTDK